jgi:hypothetical protein
LGDKLQMQIMTLKISQLINISLNYIMYIM